MSLPIRVNGVVCSSLELTKMQIQFPNTLPNCGIALALEITETKMGNGSLSILDILERPPKSMILSEAVLVSVVHVASMMKSRSIKACAAN